MCADATQPPEPAFAGLSPGEIDRIPRLPGVYMMHATDGKVLYIGKAADLQSRVRSYFTRAGDARFNVRFLMRHVASVETIITSNEKEAFLLENTLIKKEQPRYNLRLRDDKTYVSVRINIGHEWPRAVVMRRRHESSSGAVFLGPFSSAGDTRQTLRQLQRIFPIRSCPDHVLRNRSRPCLLHQIGRCSAPCVKPVDKGEYGEWVEGTMLVLKGKTQEVLKLLRDRMQTHSDKMEFERAAAIRDRIAAIESTAERQHVHKHDGEDRDVIVLERAGGRAAFAVFCYRNGLLVASRPYVFPDHDREGPDLMSEFLARFYENEAPPREVLVDPLPNDHDLLSNWLTERRETKCEILFPQRGDKLRLIEIAHENCARLLEQHLSGRKSLEEIYADIMEKFQLEEIPDPIECYDISTIQGYATVGSMVTFRQGQPDKSRYRLYKIKSLSGMDDFGSLREVLTRRFKRAVESGEMMPGLVMIDGGKGQLNVAQAVFEELGLTGIALVSIAKSRVKKRGDTVERTEERFFLPGRKNPVTFPQNSPSLYLLQQARDEAHRFGITFHRDLRKRMNLRSTLEDLPGVGKTRAATLLRALGSMRAIRESSQDTLAAVPGIPTKIAETIYRFLHSAEPPADDIAPQAPPDVPPDENALAENPESQLDPTSELEALAELDASIETIDLEEPPTPDQPE